jgi:hypothetical protein
LGTPKKINGNFKTGPALFVIIEKFVGKTVVVQATLSLFLLVYIRVKVWAENVREVWFSRVETRGRGSEPARL